MALGLNNGLTLMVNEWLEANVHDDVEIMVFRGSNRYGEYVPLNLNDKAVFEYFQNDDEILIGS